MERLKATAFRDPKQVAVSLGCVWLGPPPSPGAATWRARHAPHVTRRKSSKLAIIGGSVFLEEARGDHWSSRYYKTLWAGNNADVSAHSLLLSWIQVETKAWTWSEE